MKRSILRIEKTTYADGAERFLVQRKVWGMWFYEIINCKNYKAERTGFIKLEDAQEYIDDIYKGEASSQNYKKIVKREIIGSTEQPETMEEIYDH